MSKTLEKMIVVPQAEYDNFLQFRKIFPVWKTFQPTRAQKADLKRARADYRKGKTLTLDELKQSLGIKN